MGVSSAVFSDEPRHSMVEESGCRCACQGGGEEFDLPPDDPSNTSSSGCCNPKVFTTVLLGILSCVLMTGGVFLAFHRWDPMWLLVSGVGVILIFIGTIQHCCSDNSTPARRSSGKGGCCSRPPAPDHPHIVTHNGSLTEQLLPLTNARSVSQLSLNMLPGYFPPVVTAYGIEQHSAVVQNINRLVQQQQQQAPSPQSPGAPAGKSFILLSLPGENPPANLQNLVATVYQLDGSIVPETATTDTNPAPDTPVNVTTRTNNLVLKNAEVQTCHMWSSASVPNASELSAVSSTSSAENASTTESQRTTVTTASGTTQTEEHANSEVVEDLMDCSVDIATNCDIVADNQSTFANIPLSSSATLVDVSEPSTSSEILDSVLVDVPVSSANFTEGSGSAHLLELATTNLISVEVAQTVINEPMLCDITDLSSGLNQSSFSEQSQIAVIPDTETAVEGNNEVQTLAGTSRDAVIESNLENIPPPSYVALNHLALSSSSSNLSEIDAEIDPDGESLGRSSPPPSYEDVTHEGESSVGAFGLAYGTI